MLFCKIIKKFCLGLIKLHKTIKCCSKTFFFVYVKISLKIESHTSANQIAIKRLITVLFIVVKKIGVLEFDFPKSIQLLTKFGKSITCSAISEAITPSKAKKN